MKKYIIPDIKFTAVDIMDIITASGNGIEVSPKIPNILDIGDGRDFN